MAILKTTKRFLKSRRERNSSSSEWQRDPAFEDGSDARKSEGYIAATANYI